MCLFIKGGPYRSDKTYVVFKCLDHTYDQVMTPVMNHPVVFDEEGKYEIKMPQDHVLVPLPGAKIEEGAHSYYTRNEAETFAEYYKEVFGTKVHRAIIPSGTEFFHGYGEETVSERLIVFKDEKWFEKYLYKNSLSVSMFSPNDLTVKGVEDGVMIID